MTRVALLAAVALLAVSCRQTTIPANDTAPAASAAAPVAPPPAAAELTLSRLDCGSIHVNDMDKSFAGGSGVYPPGPYDLTDSCYLIRDGDRAMIWDTGFPEAIVGHPYAEPDQTAKMDKTLAEQLKAGGVDPAKVEFVGISHYHADHTGQAHLFSNATLLIGAADLAALKAKSEDPFMLMSQKAMERWITGGGKAEGVTGDKDVFGDGKVTMLGLPGHTPGHHSLLVRLASGPVLLTGDLYHATAARTKSGVPPFNTDKAATLKSMDAFEALAAKEKATVVIQHEPADIGKVPAFPAVAK